MTQPMIAWCVIAAVLLCAFLFRAVERHPAERDGRRQRERKPRHLIGLGKEKDMFFIPGDGEEEDDFEYL